MALTSPGVSITVNDQSQYINSAVGSVPLVVFATTQDKKYNGLLAAGTTKANAGKLLSFSSQRDLVTQMGTPSFQLSAAGSPVHGSEVNEYGLMAAYSALGLGNRCYGIRADVDLKQLIGTRVRPFGNPDDQTYWLNLASTEFGIFSLNSSTSSFAKVTPLLITDASQVNNGNAGLISTPNASVGQVGQYALVFVEPDGTMVMSVRLFLKGGVNSHSNAIGRGGYNNQWVQVGSLDWQRCLPTVTGTTVNPTIVIGSTFTVNGVVINTTGSTVTQLAADINNGGGAGAIAGVRAIVSSTNQLMIFVTNEAKSTGPSGTADGKIIITDGTNSPMKTAGVVTATVNGVKTAFCPILFYGNYAQSPANGWFSVDSQPRPTGSIWWKTSATGTGFSATLSQYSAASDRWTKLSVPMYMNSADAVYGLDPYGGGANIKTGQIIATYTATDNQSNGIKFFEQTASGVSSGTGAALPIASNPLTAGQTFTVSYSSPGSNLMSTPVTVTLSGSTGESFVADILALNLPYVTASYNTTTKQITITHTSGGIVRLLDTGSGDSMKAAGFKETSASGFSVNTVTDIIEIANLDDITDMVEYSLSTPYMSPESGTYWYYSNPNDIDIMIQTGSGWAGYQAGGTDVRNNLLSATDPAGVIIGTTQPVSQTDGTPLVGGDLWLDSADLVNFPKLYRYVKPSNQAGSWVAIDNTDHTSSNGIIFADARWDAGGTTDIVSGALPSTVNLLTSNYIDQDAPDYRLYPRGILLFNTRRSGFNVKKFVKNYFNSTAFPAPGQGNATVPGAATSLPTVTDAWVSASGLNANGAMNAGSAAQRSIVVTAMTAAINSNLSILESVYQFNLILAPNYPELIPAMITLNENRGNTAFVIGDTPMTLPPNEISISNWVNNASGTGLPSDANATPYLALYYPAGLASDLAGNTIVVPASHAVLRTYLYNDQVAYPWFAPAGTHRGLISNLSDIGYLNAATGTFVHNGVNQGLRDALYTLDINPLTQLPGTGLVVWGQKTRLGGSTSRNRVNVVRLENYLRSTFDSVANGYLFEPNDTVTRKSIKNQIEHSLNNILSLRGLYDFLVVCDTSNNTPDTVANNQLHVDVAIEPMRDVEFIYIPIAIYNPGDISALRNGR